MNDERLAIDGTYGDFLFEAEADTLLIEFPFDFSDVQKEGKARAYLSRAEAERLHGFMARWLTGAGLTPEQKQEVVQRMYRDLVLGEIEG